MYQRLLIVVLSALVLLALGISTIGVGRFVYGIIGYGISRQRKKLALLVQHSEYGALTGDGDSWEGTAHAEGREIPFVIWGNDIIPDDTMLRHLSVIIADFAKSESQAIEFLRAQEQDARNATLDFYMLDVVGDDAFTMEFVAQDDDWDRVWRVEFESGVPVWTGFDD